MNQNLQNLVKWRKVWADPSDDGRIRLRAAAFAAASHSGLWATMKEVVTEPMFLLLLVACAVYFALGRPQEAVTLIAALLAVAGISVYQAVRSNQALGALRELTQPRAQVRRDGAVTTVPVADLVVGDAVLVEEGSRVPADGTLALSNDFSVDDKKSFMAGFSNGGMMTYRAASEIEGMDAREQIMIDLVMKQIDGTENKAKLGANAMLGVTSASPTKARQRNLRLAGNE